ncbi:MAG: right-handed parallel beta-helix repeat-containing protein, partial [Verrucomicrobiae bacterium]|nr:right-handed parallel beta-helix repeat-containing protein [Verrucomicrobiae bacterium]
VVSGNDSGIAGEWEHGIYLWNSDNNLIQGNYLGTNAAGTAAIRNFADGIGMDGDAGGGYSNGNIIRNNLISGNKEYGIWAGAGSGGQIIQGNLIGTNFDGTTFIRNGIGAVSSPAPGAGIRLDSSGNTVGGTAAGEGNVISGNAGVGIALPDASSDNNLVQGNLIGTTADGSSALANLGGGI